MAADTNDAVPKVKDGKQTNDTTQVENPITHDQHNHSDKKTTQAGEQTNNGKQINQVIALSTTTAATHNDDDTKISGSKVNKGKQTNDTTQVESTITHDQKNHSDKKTTQAGEQTHNGKQIMSKPRRSARLAAAATAAAAMAAATASLPSNEATQKKNVKAKKKQQLSSRKRKPDNKQTTSTKKVLSAKRQNINPSSTSNKRNQYTALSTTTAATHNDDDTTISGSKVNNGKQTNDTTQVESTITHDQKNHSDKKTMQTGEHTNNGKQINQVTAPSTTTAITNNDDNNTISGNAKESDRDAAPSTKEIKDKTGMERTTNQPEDKNTKYNKLVQQPTTTATNTSKHLVGKDGDNSNGNVNDNDGKSNGIGTTSNDHNDQREKKRTINSENSKDVDNMTMNIDEDKDMGMDTNNINTVKNNNSHSHKDNDNDNYNDNNKDNNNANDNDREEPKLNLVIQSKQRLEERLYEQSIQNLKLSLTKCSNQARFTTNHVMKIEVTSTPSAKTNSANTTTTNKAHSVHKGSFTHEWAQFQEYMWRYKPKDTRYAINGWKHNFSETNEEYTSTKWKFGNGLFPHELDKRVFCVPKHIRKSQDLQQMMIWIELAEETLTLAKARPAVNMLDRWLDTAPSARPPG